MGKYHSLSLVQRTGSRRGGGLQAAELLHHVQDARRGQEDREPRRGHEDPHQRGQRSCSNNFYGQTFDSGQQTAAGQGRRLQVRLPRHAGTRGEFGICEDFLFLPIFCCSVSRMRSWTHFG